MQAETKGGRRNAQVSLMAVVSSRWMMIPCDSLSPRFVEI